jgi:hypothetical protein
VRKVSLGTAGYQNPKSGALLADTISGVSGMFMDEGGSPEDGAHLRW